MCSRHLIGRFILLITMIILVGCRIEGKITSENTPVEGVSVKLSGNANMQTYTDSEGYYYFEDLNGQNFTITPMLDGYTFLPEKQDVHFSMDIREANADFEAFKSCTVELLVVDNTTDLISTINQENGQIIEQISAPAGIGASHHGLAWDGNSIWINNTNSGQSILYKCNIDGSIVNSFAFPQIRFTGLVYVDGMLWACGNLNYSDYLIFKINPSDGTWISYPSPVGAPQGISYDGASNLWIVGNTAQDEIYTYDIATGGSIYQFDSPDVAPSGLEYKDGQLFVLGWNGLTTLNPYTGATISSLALPDINYGTGVLYICK